ncbi:MMPL family transporter [Streptomyces sp. NPDC087440]|uniref:MMPL family transporter n=1 Tax=Streptomyces sp. NPDC087440 TaxID=3365790 RepID=UPI0038123885
MRPTPLPTGVFGRLAAWSQRHRWGALLLWVLAVAVITVASQGVSSAYRNDFALPGTESQSASDLLERHGSAQAGGSVQIVFRDPDGLRDDRPAVEKTVVRVRELPRVADVSSPFADGSALSRDGTTGYATVVLDAASEDVPREDVVRIIDTARQQAGPGLTVALGGDAVRGAQQESGGAAEGAGLLAALVVLVLLFGSFVAAAIPLLTAVFAVGGAVGLIALASHVFTIADFTPPIMMLVGLGVGVDYALLIFYRFRRELVAGAAPQDATRAALDAAGRTVFCAGCTVIVALLGLIALGLGSLQGVALAVALTVLVTMAASLTLLPALLAFFGGRIRRTVRRRKPREEGRRWRQLASFVQRRPLPALLAAVAVLLAFSAPALGMRLGFADAGNDPVSSTSRQAYDLLAKGFGPGFNGPLIAVSRGGEGAAEGDGGAAVGGAGPAVGGAGPAHNGAGAAVGGAGAAQQLRAALSGAPGVAGVSPVLPSPDGAVSTVIVFPAGSPQDADTARLVHTLRADVLPPLAGRTGAEYLIGGPTAAAQDFADSVADRIPLFVALVVGLSTLLLMLVFRSLLIPLKAALLNLLSISAALGVITLVFQHGWFGVQPGPVEAFIPVMIFAIVFGLSMDYEVFLVARMHEEWERTGNHLHAVREGLAATGKVITAAAAIMIVVFGAFVLSPGRMLQQFGLGLAVAILLDAVVIRCLIVPAAMQLFGPRAWWLPGPLARLLPKVTLERPAPQ